MIGSAPDSRAPWIALSPTPPQPITTTDAPAGDTRHVHDGTEARHHTAPQDRGRRERDVDSERDHGLAAQHGMRRHGPEVECSGNPLVAETRVRLAAVTTTHDPRVRFTQVLVADRALVAAATRHRPVRHHRLAFGESCHAFADCQRRPLHPRDRARTGAAPASRRSRCGTRRKPSAAPAPRPALGRGTRRPRRSPTRRGRSQHVRQWSCEGA